MSLPGEKGVAKLVFKAFLDIQSVGPMGIHHRGVQSEEGAVDWGSII